MKLLLLFLSGLWTPNLWWWLAVPPVVGTITFLVKRKQAVPDGKGAWSAVGRHWAGIGWAILLAVAVLYVLSGWRPSTFGFNPHSDLMSQNDKSGPLAPLVGAISQQAVYPWVASLLLVACPWSLVSWILFIAPGARMAREKINYK